MEKIEAIIRPEKLEAVKNALAEAGFIGLNVVAVTGRGTQKGVTHIGRTGEKITVDMLPKIKLELVVKSSDKNRAIETILGSARTGVIGDGKIFVSPVSQVIKVRTGEQGEEAI
ncbi:MAG: P-II family nitrogen regulator [Dehalococcoidia bacterium]|nr:P-II family nitrogen regulator [Dehalococcoidia bacterium]